MKKVLLLFVLFVNLISAQDTIYLNQKEISSSKMEAYYYGIKNVSAEPVFYKRIYLINHTLVKESLYKTNKKKRITSHKQWYESGELYMVLDFKRGKRDGFRKVYYKNGHLKRKEIFKNGKFVSGICWSENGTEIPFFTFFKRASFVGGKAALGAYLKDKIYAKYLVMSGKKMIVRFYVNEKGVVSDFRFKKQSHKLDLDAQVRLAIENMPAWEPTIRDGAVVGQNLTLPIRF